MDRRSGFKKIEHPKLKRDEISSITGVDDIQEDSKQFNDAVYKKTTGWTYSVFEIGREIKKNNGALLSVAVRLLPTTKF